MMEYGTTRKFYWRFSYKSIAEPIAMYSDVPYMLFMKRVIPEQIPVGKGHGEFSTSFLTKGIVERTDPSN